MTYNIILNVSKFTNSFLSEQKFVYFYTEFKVSMKISNKNKSLLKVLEIDNFYPYNFHFLCDFNVRKEKH